jgi:serine/threonine-protein kinase
VTLKVGGKVALETVPSVIGQSLTAAKAALKKFNVFVDTTAYTLTAKPGYVIAQSIPSGTQKLLGSQITITVVGTPAKVVIPTFSANETPQQAGNALGRLELQVSSTPIQKFSSTVPSGDVMRSEPASGTSVPQGTFVTLVISQGTAVVMPNLIGQSPSDAQATLAASGLTLVVSTTQQPETNPDFSGVIVTQSVQAGQKVAAGTQVTVQTGVYVGGTTGTGTATTTTTVPLTTTTSTTPTSFPTPT